MQRIMRCALALVAGVSAASASLRIPTSNWTYDVLGPFPAGSREVADPVRAAPLCVMCTLLTRVNWQLEAFGGITAIPRGDATRYPSELADGGNVTWTRVVSDANGKVTLYFPNFRDGFLGEALGLAVTSAQSWALADFHVEVAGQYFVQCLGAGEVYIDDTWFRGDRCALCRALRYAGGGGQGRWLTGGPRSYGLSYWFGPNGLLLWPVRLTAGTHTLRVRTSTSFQCQFRNPPPVRSHATAPAPRRHRALIRARAQGATSGSGLYVLDIATADARAYSPDLGVITPHVVDGWLAAPYVSVVRLLPALHSAVHAALSALRVPSALRARDAAGGERWARAAVVSVRHAGGRHTRCQHRAAARERVRRCLPCAAAGPGVPCDRCAAADGGSAVRRARCAHAHAAAGRHGGRRGRARGSQRLSALHRLPCRRVSVHVSGRGRHGAVCSRARPRP